MSFLVALLVSHAFASQRTFSAVGEQIDVSLEQVDAKGTKYYLEIEGTGSSIDKQIFVVTHEQSDVRGEDFRLPKCDCFVRLGGGAANPYAKPPIAGILTHQNRDIKLTAKTRAIDLQKAYAAQECLTAKTKAEADQAITTALDQANAACGTKLQVKTDWSSFSNPGLACNGREALMAVADLCADADYKKVMAQIKTFAIKKAEGEPFARKGGEVTYSVHALPENTRFNANLFLAGSL